eukprot:SAG31_NODE_2836_length_5019_cov_2.059350_2_plen_204_part_00
MRRQTLSGVDGNRANSRASLGPARMSMAGPGGGAAGKRGRKSSATRQSLSRRSSAYGGGPSVARKTDPRPIKDKAWMNGTIKSVIMHLSESGYDANISPKILHAPTSKDFANMFGFLCCQLDPNHKPNPSLVDEVLETMKSYRYPFSISKSALQSIGSPHTWPHLLAVLGWMVELLEYDAEAHQDGDEFAEEVRFHACNAAAS